MTTLRTRQPSDLSPDDQTILERVAKRMGQRPEEVLRPGIFGVQAHWPAWLERITSRPCTAIACTGRFRSSPRKRCTSRYR